MIDHVSSIFEKETADAWYAREAEYLLPDGFSCPKCNGSTFTKETDILDVWFDSGSSSIAVLEAERHLPWPADVYLEGPDQHRGWFNSSLMVGLTAHDKAPYKTVITHGWTVDGDGKAMHKSTGNAMPSDEVVGKHGAEVLRLWVASSDYQEEVRVSTEILNRMVDAYRKLRNTARYALGNLYDFDPERDGVAEAEMCEIDRWALFVTDGFMKQVIDSYKKFDYSDVYHRIYKYATVTLSNTYFDILKDRLYTFAPKSRGRRSAQTALHEIVTKFARMLAPIIPFTADEIWEYIPGKLEASVHLSEFEEAQLRDENVELIKRWRYIFLVSGRPAADGEQSVGVQSALERATERNVIGSSLAVQDDALSALELERERKKIGSSLEASITIKTGSEGIKLLRRFSDEELIEIFIVSEVVLEEHGSGTAFSVRVEHAKGQKCERCWHWSETVGKDPRVPEVDERCIRQLEEGWGL